MAGNSDSEMLFRIVIGHAPKSGPVHSRRSASFRSVVMSCKCWFTYVCPLGLLMHGCALVFQCEWDGT